MAYPNDNIVGPVSTIKLPRRNSDGSYPVEGDVFYVDALGNPAIGSSALIARSFVSLANLAAIQGQATISKVKVYYAVDTGKQYMWVGTGSTGAWNVAEVNAGLALGETSATAYRGDRGKTAYDFSQAPASAAEAVAKNDVKFLKAKALSDATALADFWLTKRTKMPDGATAVYSQELWATADGWSASTGAVAVAGGIITLTASGSGAIMYKSFAAEWAGKLLVLSYKCAKTVYVNLGGAYSQTFPASPDRYKTVTYVCPVSVTGTEYLRIGPTGSANLDTMMIDWIWIGDYSYLPGSLSEEAARIADQLGDTPGTPVAASATITSNGTNVNTPSRGTLTTTTNLPANDSTFKIGQKTYTWKSVLTPAEGEVLIGATVAACMLNAKNAVNGDAGTLGSTHQCTANTLFTALSGYTTAIVVDSILRGTVGNGATYEIVAGAGSELTASGALATGGVDDTVTIGGKVYTFVGAITTGSRVEGEVKVGLTYSESLLYLSYAITRRNPSAFDYNGTTPIYGIAATHPLVYAVSAGAITITAGLASANGTVLTPTTGESGNSITLAKSASATTLTLSGTTLLGGCSDAAAKLSYLVARASQNLDAKTSVAAADEILVLDSVTGKLKKRVSFTNFKASLFAEGDHPATLTPGTSGTITLDASYDSLHYVRQGNQLFVTGKLLVASVSSPVGSVVKLSIPVAIGGYTDTGEEPGGTVAYFSNGSGSYSSKVYYGAAAQAYVNVVIDAATVQANDRIIVSFSVFV